MIATSIDSKESEALARYLLSMNPAASPHTSSSMKQSRFDDPKMLNLFGNEESDRRRDDLSLRMAPAGARKLTFRKPNAATQNPGKVIGIEMTQGPIGNIYVANIIPNTEAAKYEREGKLKVGDEIVMVSATFGDEDWSCRGVGVSRLYSSMKARQGGNIAFVFENRGKNDKRIAKAAEEGDKQKKANGTSTERA
jgi:C-terminal processing protease CtpA/Prc